MTALFLQQIVAWEEAEGVVGVIGSTTCNLIAVTSLQLKLRRSRKLRSLRSLQLRLLPHVGTFPLLVKVIPWEVPELVEPSTPLPEPLTAKTPVVEPLAVEASVAGHAAGEPSVAKPSVGEPGGGGSESVSQIRNVT